MSDFDLKKELKICKKCASTGDKIAKQQLAKLKESLLDAKEQIQQDINEFENSNCDIEEMNDALKKQLIDIQSSFISLAKISDSDLKFLRKNLSKFSVTLFGRTMAGKSTLMEILKHGDGSSIGQGSQRTTRDVRTYEWNGLTITDVPGIGAFEGKEDEDIAFKVAKSADLIIFLLTDDAPQASEAECFSRIVKLGKPIICVINVKASININRSQKTIEREISRRFDMQRLSGIKNQFLNYANKIGQEWSNIPFVYVHLKSAYLAQTSENQEFSQRMYELSRIDSLKQLLVSQVRENGGFYRIKTFVDIIDNPMISTVTTLFDQSQQNGMQGRTILGKYKILEEWKSKSTKDYKERVQALINTIKSELSQEVAQFAEDHLGDTDADKAWKAVFDNKKVVERCESLLSELNNKCSQKIEEISREIQNEMKFNSVISADFSLGNKNRKIIDGKKIWDWSFEIAGAGVSIAWIITSLVGAAAAGPLGWITLGVAALGFLGSLFFKSRQNKEKEARQRLERELRESIDKICSSLKSNMEKQLNKLLNQRINPFLSELKRLNQILFNLSDIQKRLAQDLNNHVLEINMEFLNSVLKLIDYEETVTTIEAVGRLPGCLCFVLLKKGEKVSDTQNIQISTLINENIFFINNIIDKSKLISTILKLGYDNESQPAFYTVTIDKKSEVAHVNADFEDMNIINRISIAQQLTGMIVTK